MFRSNLACNSIHHQQQPDMNGSNGGSSGGSSSPSLLLSPPAASSGYGKPSLICSGCEEGTRNPEPKPRWNPRPEQIRILEGIFNSGMVNPPRDEIRRIRLQLQEYGQVGDANVFYWFQNRKSRTKNKLRAAGQLPQQHGRAALARACAAASSPAPAPSTNSNPAALYYHSRPTPTPTPLARDQLTSPESLLLEWPQSQYMPATELGGVLSSHTQTPAVTHPSISPGVLLGLCNEAQGQEFMDDMSCCSKGFGHYMDMSCTELSSKTDAVSAVIREDEKARLGLLHYGIGVTAAATPAPHHHHHHHLASPVHAAAAAADASTAMLPFTTAATTPSNVVVATSSALADQLQGLLDAGLLQGGAAPLPSAMVVAVSRDDVTMCMRTTNYSFPAMMHLNVRMFGEAAVLVRNGGETVLVDDSGVTVEPLQQGATYYVLATEDAVQ
ncbi:hypothetical protein E2562_031004 [Oryza meyeriana var. granulata]|uniref:Homeobox domain-containing protein n=1 Tax=Oryza meyeriana var. granulata TaxID=110450 RepID=A0A6G1ERK2_9ORYZ|nr:hypothetical protein E2562_031004 [Oryza meyeriana var. granulata]